MSNETFRPAEYDCCECGRHVVVLTSPVAPEPPFCGACLLIPGWHTRPNIARLIDPDHARNPPNLGPAEGRTL